MSGRSKMKTLSKIKIISTQDIIDSESLESENLVRLKLTTRKGTRI